MLYQTQIKVIDETVGAAAECQGNGIRLLVI
jgi:hypothetical protein